MRAAIAFAGFGFTASSAFAVSLTWNAGNTNNSAAIDVATGDWNTTAGNIVWSDGPTFNVIWSQTRSIPANIGANATGVIHNSATSILILSGTNKKTCADTSTVNADTLRITRTADPLNVKLTAPADQGHCSMLLAQSGNVAQRSGHSLRIDSTNGQILENPEGTKLWTREYQPGWEPTN